MSKYNTSYEFKKTNLTHQEACFFETFNDVMRFPMLEDFIYTLKETQETYEKANRLEGELNEIHLAINALGLSEQIQNQINKNREELEKDDIPF